MAARGSCWSSGTHILLLTLALACWWAIIDDVEGLGIKYATYVDDTCEVEMFYSISFGALGVDSSGEFDRLNRCVHATVRTCSQIVPDL